MAKSYIVFNRHAPTTAAPTPMVTGVGLTAVMQLQFATGVHARLIKWGCSFDRSAGDAAAAPVQVELFESTAAAISVIAYVSADIMPYNDRNATANTAGSTGRPLNLSISRSGYAGTHIPATDYRGLDLQILPPTGLYVYDWPLDTPCDVAPQAYVRLQVTAGVSVGMYAFIVFEV